MWLFNRTYLSMQESYWITVTRSHTFSAMHYCLLHLNTKKLVVCTFRHARSPNWWCWYYPFVGYNIICFSVDLQTGKWFKTFHSSLRDFLKLVISQESGQKKRREGEWRVTLNVIKVHLQSSQIWHSIKGVFVQLSNPVTIEIPVRNIQEQSNSWLSGGWRSWLTRFLILSGLWMCMAASHECCCCSGPYTCEEWKKCSTANTNILWYLQMA